MGAWEEFVNHWKKLQFRDLFGIFFILLMVVITLASNMFLKSFVDSKPTGRKTVLGNVTHIPNVTDLMGR